MTPEDELCVLLARARIPPEAERRARELLATPLHWDLILERVRIHEILPLVHRNLERLGFPGVPDPVRQRLVARFRMNQLRSGLLAQELGRLLRVLDEAGIPAIPLKGTALAEELYGDPALRISDDIDLLVPPQTATRALDLLLTSGYGVDFGEPLFRDLLLRYGKDCTLEPLDRMSPCILELHWGLFWGGALERKLSEEVWREARTKTFFGIPARTLSPEWEFLYLTIHAARHGLLALKWFVDLDELCRRGAIDWETVRDKAQRLGWQSIVQSTLGTCTALFGTPTPPAFPPRVQPVPNRFPDSPLQVPSEIVLSARLLKTPSEKLRFWAIRLFVPTLADQQFIRLPRSLSFLYYPLRPLRVIFLVAGWLVRAGVQKLSAVLGR